MGIRLDMPRPDVAASQSSVTHALYTHCVDTSNTQNCETQRSSEYTEFPNVNFSILICTLHEIRAVIAQSV
jgi:hypothetical protein